MSFEPHDLVIIRIPEFDPKKDSYKLFLERFDHFWQGIYNSMSLTGSLWVFMPNIFANGELYPLAWELIDRIRASTKFRLKNILVVYREKPYAQTPLAQSYFNIAFFVKSLNQYYFDKDAIREPHVFKDIEWGKRLVGTSGYSERKRNRYSSKGRDSGNVFYKVERNSEGKILKIYEYSDEELYEKIVKVSTKRGSIILSNVTNLALSKIVKDLGRELKSVGV